MSHISAYFSLDHVGGKHDVKEIKRELDTFPGVTSVSVNANNGQIAVDYDATGVTRNQLQNKLEELGYQIAGASIRQLTD